MGLKRYLHNAVEQGVLNPEFEGYRNFRLEVYDRKNNFDTVYEGCFLVPEDLFDKLYELMDDYETDLPLYIYHEHKKEVKED